jgi:hypothetical protein
MLASPTDTRRRSHQPVVLVAMILTVVLFFGAGVAVAATSGWKHLGSLTISGASWHRCGEAQLVATRDAKSFARYATSSTCGTARNSSAGWLGAAVQLYKNGAVCGVTSWKYNASTTGTFGVGAVLCSGSGSFQTYALSRFWNPNTSAYVGDYGIWSPVQSY